MRAKRKFVERVTRHLPVLHGRYREMGSLAALGQLGGPQMCELNKHIATCGACRRFLESVGQASVQVLPVLAEDRIRATDITPPVGMRARFLDRLAEERLRSENKGKSDATAIGLRLQVLAHSAKNSGAKETAFDQEEELVFQRFVPTEVEKFPPPPSGGGRLKVWPTAAAIAATALIGVGGFYLGRKTPRAGTTQMVRSVPTSATIVETATSANDPVATLERDKHVLETQLVELKGRLTEAKADQDSLRKELVAANVKLASFQQTEAAAARENLKEVQDSKTEAAQLASETERLRQQLAASETKLSLARQRTGEVSEKLQITEANLQEQLNLKDAKSQMGELVAARNLHIVDVYDADPSGKRQRAFGRVFYTEGKSVVFYAYDLEDARQVKANVVFHVWGGKAGVKEVTHNLGILHKDDDGQSRWKMTFDDPNVLSQINSVFVTAESANKQYDEPHGKKVLFAYFGSPPNHP